LSREEKYNAKQAIDTFFWRAGDVLSALLVFVGTQVLAFKTQHFALVNMVLVAIWLMIAFWTGRENAKMTKET
jgi:AAA family ATP:ADP antiporter